MDPDEPEGVDGTAPRGSTEAAEDGPPSAERSRPRFLVPVLVAAGVLLLLGGLYVADLVAARGTIPRGTVVEGVEVGGLDPAAAESTLRSALGRPATTPLPVRAGPVRATLDPAAAGLSLDWAATLDRAGSPPLNPWTRLRSWSTTRQVEVVRSVDRAMLTAAVGGLRAEIDRETVEGAVGFEGVTPRPVTPRDGQRLDVAAAVDAVAAQWSGGGPVELPVTKQPATIGQDAVDTALVIAQRAVGSPFEVGGRDGAVAALSPADIAARLSFAPDGPTLVPRFDVDSAIGVLAPQLAGTETRRRDAMVRLGPGGPEVVPAVDGRVVDWPATLADPAARVTGADRSAQAVYAERTAEFSTVDAQRLGIREVIGEFTTSGFAPASGVNIRRVAQEVQGAVVRPGQTFSLNGYTGTRGTAQGYVESGIILDGRPDTAVGGGISQFATTLYNASYFAGMQDVEHREHSYYISRYPEAREATVFEGVIDLRFAVPTPTGILIETIGTQSSITVRIWGTKTVNVQSITGERSDVTSPETVRIPAGEDCAASSGGEGFTSRNTRVITDARSGAELSRKTNTVRYNPQPKVICG